MHLAPDSRPSGRLIDYIALARPDHWIKHVFIIPGIALAWVLHGRLPEDVAAHVLLGFASAALLASANYVINEWLDRETDRHHPIGTQSDSVPEATEA